MNNENQVASYISPKTFMRSSLIHGLGTFAKERIVKGEIVFIKGGHIVTKRELYFSEKISSYHPIADEFFIGAKSREEENRIKLFVNHSCDPNCGLRGDIVFVALREIKEGEELSFDYAMLDNEEYTLGCNCGSACCRKIVTGFDWKIKELQTKYKGYFSRYLADKIAQLQE
jgi:hypothetical protein